MIPCSVPLSPDESIEYGTLSCAVSADILANLWEAVGHLKGQLLTIADATFSDPEQRKAYKDLVKNTLQDWSLNAMQNSVSYPIKTLAILCGDKEESSFPTSPEFSNVKYKYIRSAK